jgi:hypothetical protein
MFSIVLTQQYFSEYFPTVWYLLSLHIRNVWASRQESKWQTFTGLSIMYNFSTRKKICIHVSWRLLLIIYVITFLKCLAILVLYPARLKSALSKITQDSDQWIKPQNVSYSPSSSLPTNSTFTQMDVMPTVPPSSMFTSYGLKVCWFT